MSYLGELNFVLPPRARNLQFGFLQSSIVVHLRRLINEQVSQLRPLALPKWETNNLSG